jgi:uncharacterized membrane protein YkoI
MRAFLLFALALGAAGAARAAAPACKEAQTGLAARARVSCREARKKALEAVGRGRLHVRSAELEEEKGRLVYSFDIERKGRGGIEEVLVDASSGEVVSVAHETAAAEAAERD